MTLVIGYGNSLMGDDGFGLKVVKKLQKRVKNKNVKFLLLYQLTPELSLNIKDFNEIIFVDASYGLPEFAIACPIFDETHSSITHYLNPKTLIKMTKELFNVELNFYVYSVLCSEFKMQENLSKQMSKPLKNIVNWIEFELQYNGLNI